MGVYLSTPKIDKTSDDGENEKLRYGVSSMQGWRTSMEDAHAALLDLDNSTSFFGVYDGHGGQAVSKFCAKYLHQQLLKQEAYAAGDIGTAAHKSFLSGLLSSFNLLGHTTPIQAGSLLLLGPFLDYWLTEKRVNMFKYDISSMDFLVLLIDDKELVENPMIDAWLLKNRKSPWVGKKEGLQGCWIFY
ncbi:unnamed protein product [Lactuca saligna]|uniref:protein-serine/threonine phosphatase n=1 Tax=Lactuca saligna TaxID=75948 RepID=A0AA36A617_LACSI|nr:unnamed protein product [Lactuca saligna]